MWLVLAGCAQSPSEHRPNAEKPPELALRFSGPAPHNLLMLSLDTMRRDRMGRYAGGDSLTPFLDLLAGEGVVADDFASCSNWTVAATSCIEAGADLLDRAPDRGMIPIVNASILEPIPTEEMLPAWLRVQGGYSSLLVTTNGYFSSAHGNAQGYDRIEYDGAHTATWAWNRAKELIVADEGGTPLVSPWFLHLHFFETHRPYQPPDEYLGGLDGLPEVPFDLSTEQGQSDASSAIAGHGVSRPVAEAIEQNLSIRYDGEVRFFDDQLRAVWADLERLGFLDDTLVVFWTDHGEELWEHDVSEHGKFLLSPENDGILLFWSRDLVPGAWTGPVSGVDVAPTVLSALGFDVPDTVTGVPLGRAPFDRARFATTDAYLGPLASVRKDGWRLQFRWDGSTLRLFDDRTDPLDLVDRYDPTDPHATELWDLLQPEIAALQPYVDQDPRGYRLIWPVDLP